MTPRDSLMAQAFVLSQEINRSTRALQSLPVPDELRSRVEARFNTEFGRLTQQVRELRSDLGRPGQPFAESWARLADLQRVSEQVFQEFLSFAHGAMARGAELDGGLCALTDALLADLEAWSDVAWGRFTVPDTREFIRETAEIIRVRYPEMSLWSIPFAAHEFGHFLGPELRSRDPAGERYPLQALLRTADESRSGAEHTQDWYHRQEYFADVFASYTIGPAYAAAFMFLRVNPCTAGIVTLTHPSAIQRVHAIFRTLERAAAARPGMGSALQAFVVEMRTTWDGMLEAAGEPRDPRAASAVRAQAEEDAHELLQLLTENTPESLAFGPAEWARATALGAALSVDPAVDFDPPGAVPGGTTRREVLNAAWFARMSVSDAEPMTIGTIAERAMRCYRVLPAL